MKYKAIFFDRDGTLTYFTTEKEEWRDKQISSWSSKPFELDYDKMMSLFQLASEGRKPWYKTLDDEREFFKRYYYHLLVGEGVTEDTKTKQCVRARSSSQRQSESLWKWKPYPPLFSENLSKRLKSMLRKDKEYAKHSGLSFTTNSSVRLIFP